MPEIDAATAERIVKENQQKATDKAKELLATPGADAAAGTRLVTAPIMPTIDYGTVETITRQAGRIQRGDYVPIGILERIQIEPSGIPKEIVMDGRRQPNPILARAETEPTFTASLDWMSQGPLVGLSLDEKELLLIPPMIAPPPLPDPFWKMPKLYDGQGNYIGDSLEPGPGQTNALEPPRVPQLLGCFCWGGCEVASQTWMAFFPIHQMLLLGQKPTMPQMSVWRGQAPPAPSAAFRIIDWKANAAGYHCCLIYQPETRRAHILFGEFSIRNF